MKYTQNLHTHCTYCDGKDTPEQIVKKAIEIGFDAIGFSSHAPFDFDAGYTLKEDRVPTYIAEISSLKEKYAEKIDIFCGLELDYFSVENCKFDYTIGSVHLLRLSGKYFDVDHSLDTTKKMRNEYFGGDPIGYAKEYYRLVGELADKKSFDILGHIDLLTKFNELDPLIDTESKEYRSAALEAVHSLSGRVTAFEVNTGAISRGYRTTPYPDAFILKELKALGQNVIITSDCHDMRFLDQSYDDALELIRCCGFNKVLKKTKTGFEEMPL